jgi:amidohydrolase
MSHPFLKEAESLFDYVVSIRRDLHRHPELGFKETRTAGVVASELRSLGLEIATGVAETGVVALLEGARPGPAILLRFDMDALPIQEETGAEYASQNPGVMHACGHDGHTAIGLTVARLLHAHRQDLAGVVKLVFQPAEEGLGGAKRMIDEGVLQAPEPAMALGVHLWNHKPLGWLGVTAGPAMAAADIFTIRIVGKGGHGAMPHETVDPVVAAAQIVSALQTIVGRNVPPMETAVVTVAMIHGGDAFNVIPSQVEMKGTLRAFDPQVRQLLIERLNAIVHNIALAMGCRATIEIESLTPALVNDPQSASRLQNVVRRVLPDCNLETDYRVMGSEDMAYFLQEAPGCFIFVGSANAEKDLNAAHHHPRFDFDERALPIAAAIIAEAVADFLGAGQNGA